MRTFAIDFETYYKTCDDNPGSAYGLKNLSMRKYVDDPRFDALLVSVADNTTGFHWVGDPKKFDWNQLDGAQLLAHNAQFETTIWRRLCRDGVIPEGIAPAAWQDTADMAAALGVQRNLRNASKVLLNRDIVKTILGSMDGMTRAQLYGDPQRLAAVSEYCLLDSVTTHNLWTTCESQWPQSERDISRLNRDTCARGFRVDRANLRKEYEHLMTCRHEAALLLPWFEGVYEKLLSPAKMRAQAKLDGIADVPASMAKDSLPAMLWEEKYAPQYKWIGAVRDVRRLNSFVKKFELLLNGLSEDDIFSYQTRYFGAGTGRFTSGAAEDEDDNAEDRVFNTLNMPNREKMTAEMMFNTDLRANIIPKSSDNVFFIYDYRQVEAVILLYLCGDTTTLDLVRKGMPVYEAHARATMGWTGGKLKDEDPVLYKFAKARVLGCGYGIGAPKFKKQFLPREPVEVCADIVKAYRSANPAVVNYWRRHDRFVKYSANAGDATHSVDLRSGRKLIYHNPRWNTDVSSAFGPRIVAESFRGGRTKSLYGGLLTENDVQGTARDVLCSGWRALESQGLASRVWLTVYDEFALEISRDEAAHAQDIADIIDHAADAWLPGCPISGSWEIRERY